MAGADGAEREKRRESCGEAVKGEPGKEKKEKQRKGQGLSRESREAGKREGQGERRTESTRAEGAQALGEPSPTCPPPCRDSPSCSRKMRRAGLGSSVFITPSPPAPSLLARKLINIPLWLGRPSLLPPLTPPCSAPPAPARLCAWTSRGGQPGPLWGPCSPLPPGKIKPCPPSLAAGSLDTFPRGGEGASGSQSS